MKLRMLIIMPSRYNEYSQGLQYMNCLFQVTEHELPINEVDTKVTAALN